MQPPRRPGVLPAKPFEPKLKLSQNTLLALRTLVRPYVGRRLPRAKCRVLAQAVADAHPGHVVVAFDCTSDLDRRTETLNVLLVVDGVQDQGLVFGRTRPDGSIYGNPANDG